MVNIFQKAHSGRTQTYRNDISKRHKDFAFHLSITPVQNSRGAPANFHSLSVLTPLPASTESHPISVEMALIQSGPAAAGGEEAGEPGNLPRIGSRTFRISDTSTEVSTPGLETQRGRVHRVKMPSFWPLLPLQPRGLPNTNPPNRCLLADTSACLLATSTSSPG